METSGHLTLVRQGFRLLGSQELNTTIAIAGDLIPHLRPKVVKNI